LLPCFREEGERKRKRKGGRGERKREKNTKKEKEGKEKIPFNRTSSKTTKSTKRRGGGGGKKKKKGGKEKEEGVGKPNRWSLAPFGRKLIIAFILFTESKKKKRGKKKKERGERRKDKGVELWNIAFLPHLIKKRGKKEGGGSKGEW